MAHATNRIVLAAAVSALLAGCVTTASLRAGRQAEQLKEYDRAIIEYTKVLRAHPDNQMARESLERAKLRSSITGWSAA